MKKKIALADCLMTIAMTVVLTYGLSQTLVSDYHLGDIIVPALSLTVVLTLFFTVPLTALLAGITLTLTVLFVLFTDMREDVQTFLDEFTHWTMNWQPDPLLDGLTIWGLTAAVLIPVFLLIRYRAPTPILLATGVVLFFGLDMLFAELPDLTILIFFGLALLQMAQNGYEPKSRAGLFLLCALPFCLLIVFLAGQITPLEQGLGQSIMDTLSEELGGIFPAGAEQNATDVTDVGGELGGPYNPLGIDMLAYRPPPLRFQAASPYLRSGLGQVYDGRSWSPPANKTDFDSDSTMDNALRRIIHYVSTVEMLPGRTATGDDDELFWLTGDEETITTLMKQQTRYGYVRHLPDSLSRLYLPYDSYTVVYGGRERLSLIDNALVHADGRVPGNLAYAVGVIQNPDGITDLMWLYALRRGGIDRDEQNLAAGEAAYDRNYGEIQATVGREKDEVALLRLLRQWKEENELVYGQYLQIPESMPSRIGDLAADIAVYGNDYDNAVAIEKYLSSNYTYNTNMQPTPKGQDFVDYFLFTQKEGYCTYFATAMAMLCRSAGIPARYVDGFAPSTRFENGEFIYDDSSAHAWTEVYIGGCGWIPFEPTAGFSSRHYLPDSPPPAATATPEPTEQPSATPAPTPSSTPAPTVTDKPESNPKNPEKPLPPFVKFILLAIAAALLILVVRRLLIRRRHRFLDSMDGVPYDEALVRRIRKHIEFLLRQVKLSPKPEETLGEYAVRAQAAWPLEQDKMKRLFALLSRERFGGKPFGEMESYALMELTMELERYAKVYVPMVKYKILRMLRIL